MAEKFESGYPASSLGARAGPNTPKWWSDTGPSWDPETGLDIYGNYGGPIGTSGPMVGVGSDRGDAVNIANGYGFMNPAERPATTEPTGMPTAAIGGGQATLQPGYAPQLMNTGLFGGQFQNLMMQQPPFYNPLMGFNGFQNFGGLFGQQQYAMNQYRGSGYLMPPPQQPQQQFNQQMPAFFDSLAYRPL